MRHQASRGPRAHQQLQALLHPDQEVGQLAETQTVPPLGLDSQQSVQATQLEAVELRAIVTA